MTALDDALWPRAALPRRPMLGAVLDALTAWGVGDGAPPPSVWVGRAGFGASADGVVVAIPEIVERYRWTTTDVAEAFELLQARDLIPMDYVGRFVCLVCQGAGRYFRSASSGDCQTCDRTGVRPHPFDVAMLASWASLGFAAGDDGAPGILGAEELARQPAPPGPVMWRVGALSPDAVPRHGPAAEIQRAGLGIRRTGGVTVLSVPPLGLVTP